MRYYGGIDLHSNNSYVVVIDADGASVFRGRLANDLTAIAGAFAAFGDGLAGIAVESTYNWYWLVDGLIDLGHRLHLANPAAIQSYQGIKHTDDPWDAPRDAHGAGGDAPARHPANRLYLPAGRPGRPGSVAPAH